MEHANKQIKKKTFSCVSTAFYFILWYKWINRLYKVKIWETRKACTHAGIFLDVLKCLHKFCTLFVCSVATLSSTRLAWRSSCSSYTAWCQWLYLIWLLIWRSTIRATCFFVSVGSWCYLNVNFRTRILWDSGKCCGLIYLARISIFSCV